MHQPVTMPPMRVRVRVLVGAVTIPIDVRAHTVGEARALARWYGWLACGCRVGWNSTASLAAEVLG